MNQRETEFEKVITDTLESIKSLLIEKGREYRRNENPFHNFERGAEMNGGTREEVLQGFLLKHLISVEDIRNDMKKDIIPLRSKVEEKYNDILVYFLIEKAMVLENVNHYGECQK